MTTFAGSDGRARWAGVFEGSGHWSGTHPQPDHTLLAAVRALGASADPPTELVLASLEAAARADLDPAAGVRRALAEERERLGYSAGVVCVAWADLRDDGLARMGGSGDVRGWVLRDGELRRVVRDQLLRTDRSARAGASGFPSILEHALLGEPWAADGPVAVSDIETWAGDRLVLASSSIWWSIPEVAIEWWLGSLPLEDVVEAVSDRIGEPLALLVAEVR